jgi:pseudaminic acid synthase
MQPIQIGARQIGPGHPPYVIAELSCNHNGSLERALAIVEQAKACGADAIKLQTYRADTITIDHDAPEFMIHGGLWDGKNLFQLYREASMPWEWHRPLFEHARSIGIDIFSSPFDFSAVDLLEELGAPAYKIASFEAVDLPLIQRAAATGKPLIISTGMADEAEIAEALSAARGAGAGGVALLHCVSGYPTPPKEANLRTIPDMITRFGVPVGLSDHTLGTAVSVASVALGASIIEKHFTLARADGGFDAAFSLEPDELRLLTESARHAWEALGNVSYVQKPSELPNAKFRRSLYVVRDIEAGEVFTSENIRSIRPSNGLPPKHYPEILGKTAAFHLKRGTPLSWAAVVDGKSEA